MVDTKAKVDLAIIMVNYNMRDDILACLQTLKQDIAQTNLNIKVVVVDNGSTDNLGRVLTNQYPEVLFVPTGENLGYGKGNNVGFASVDATYYLVLNPDTKMVQPKTLERMYNWMEKNDQVGMFGPKLYYPDGTLQLSCFRFPKFLDKPMRQLKLEWIESVRKRIDFFMMKDFDHQTARPVDWLMGSALFIRKTTLDEVGGFDDNFFMYFEDCDLARRFWQHHWPVYYVPEIVIEHVHQRATTKSGGVIRSLFTSRLAREHMKSWLYYYKKWRGQHPKPGSLM